MPGFRAILVGLVAIGTLAAATGGEAQPLKIGLMSDQNGPFSTLAGPGSTVAARMAVEDYGGTVLGRPIEILVADHQNKPDVGSAIASRWFDQEGVSAIADLPVTPVALAVQFVAKQKNRITLVSGAGSTDLVGKNCSPTGFLWTYNTYSLPNGTALAMTKARGDSWFFITADYTFGHLMEAEASRVVKANGGVVVGSVRHPLATNDFSSYLLQAQASKAKVIGLANGGADTVTAIKQASEFGIREGGQSLAAMILFVPDIISMGQDKAKDLYLTSGFYWDLDEQTRAWSKRFSERFDGKLPTELQAGVYSEITHYLKAVAAAGTDEAMAVAAKMRELPVSDATTKSARIREDGYLLRDFYLFRVKGTAEAKKPNDFYELIQTIPAATAAPPTEGAGCPLVKP